MQTDELHLVWKGILEKIGNKITRNNLDFLMTDTRLVSMAGKEVIILVPNRFLGDRIREQCYDLILSAFEKEMGSSGVRIQFVVEDTQMGREVQGGTVKAPLRKVDEKKRGGLNSPYTFASFVVGAGNQFAHAASRKVAECPGTAYNPLFIYGDVGLGKTHLLSAIGNYLTEEKRNLRVAYITSEQFTNDVINSIRYEKMMEFRNRYRNVDVLLIDDIQFIAGKEKTQEEFFHTFNTLYEENKQVVFSSDRPAKEMSDIEDRLRSRFEMGLVADIQPPDLETKMAILYKKAATEGITITEEVALLLASHTRSNIRELEGALIRLGAHSSLMGQKMTLDFARHALRDTLIDIQKEVTIHEVQKAVAERFQMKVSDLKSKRRMKSLVFPRQIAMYLCRELTKASFPETGFAFGGKDHSTVIHACKQIEKQKENDITLKETLGFLVKKIKEGK